MNLISVTALVVVICRAASARFMPPSFVSWHHGLLLATTPTERSGSGKHKVPMRETLKSDDNAGIDIQRAHECVDHVGKCSVEDLETMRNALHAERLNNIITGNVGVSNPLGPDALLDHRLLEEDLSRQLALLKREMKPEFPSVFLSGGTHTAANHAIEERETMVMLENGLAETMAIGAAILLVVMMPYLVQV